MLIIELIQAHDVPVRTMVWSHNDNWMVTGDHAGYVKYWQSNMNNVRMFQAHKEPVRGIRFVILLIVEKLSINMFLIVIGILFAVLVHPIINLQRAVMMERCVYGISCDVKRSAFCEVTVQMSNVSIGIRRKRS